MPEGPSAPWAQGGLDRAALLGWLQEDAPGRLENLWGWADGVRQRHVGDAVWLRGLVEISNHCARSCTYCGISASSPPVGRYRMAPEEILEAAEKAATYGFGTVVLQAGEDPGLTGPFVAEVVSSIKAKTGLAVTLSLGERPDEDLAAWRMAGADRYLLRFETSDLGLYGRIHPDMGGASDRLAQLCRMRGMGFEIGTGVMVGIPGQTWASLAEDLEIFRSLDVDMIGVGPYLESDGSPLAGGLGEALKKSAGAEQVPADETTTLKVLALARLVRPDANIPATTALATLDPAGGRPDALRRGANVVMPNLTPPRYRRLYRIYPGKADVHETADVSWASIEGQLETLGRTVGRGPGGRGAVDVGYGDRNWFKPQL